MISIRWSKSDWIKIDRALSVMRLFFICSNGYGRGNREWTSCEWIFICLFSGVGFVGSGLKLFVLPNCWSFQDNHSAPCKNFWISRQVSSALYEKLEISHDLWRNFRTEKHYCDVSWTTLGHVLKIFSVVKILFRLEMFCWNDKEIRFKRKWTDLVVICVAPRLSSKTLIYW